MATNTAVEHKALSPKSTSSGSLHNHHHQPHHDNHHHDSPLLFDALYEKNFGLAAALIAENRGLNYISAIHSNNGVLHIAVLTDAPLSIIESLVLDKGMDINKPNDFGRSPLFLAARHNCRLSTIKFLVQSGGKLNCVDKYNYTPLMSASYNGASLEMVKTLVELGADAHAKDQLGHYATHWAKEGNHPEIVAYLEKITAETPKENEALSPSNGSPKTRESKSAVKESPSEGSSNSVKRMKTQLEEAEENGTDAKDDVRKDQPK